MPEALAGLFGLLIGSFLNVCIYRWPRDLSVVAPRSRCPACETQIAWYDNIPILSFFILGGRCRKCGSKIPWRYPVVELLTALSFVWFVHEYGLSLAAAKYCVFAALLIGLAFADADTRILPDELTLGGAVIGFVFSIWIPIPDSTVQPSWAEALLGGFVCAGVLWLCGWAYETLRHREGLGFGDVKMLAMIGMFLGLQATLLTVILGSLVGAIAGLVWIRAAGKDAASFQLPFGTFLAAGALLATVEGKSLIGWYAQSFL